MPTPARSSRPTLTTHDVDDGSQVGPLLDQVDGPLASFTGDGAYDQDGVYASVAERHPEAAVIVPPRSTAVPSETAETAPTQRDRHLQLIAEHGRMGWQKASGYTEPRPRRGHDRPLQARDRGRAALAHGRASGDRDGRRGPGPEPHAGAGTPELRPHRMTQDGVGVTAPAPLIRATSVDAPFRARGNFRTVVARGRMLPSVRPLVRQRTAAGLYGSSRTGSQITAAYSRYGVAHWFSRSRLADRCAMPSFRSPHALAAPARLRGRAGAL